MYLCTVLQVVVRTRFFSGWRGSSCPVTRPASLSPAGQAAHGALCFHSPAFWSHSAFQRWPAPSRRSPCFQTICPFECSMKSPLSTPYTGPQRCSISVQILSRGDCHLSPLIQLKAFGWLALWAPGRCFINHRQSVKFPYSIVQNGVYGGKITIQSKQNRHTTLSCKDILINFLSQRGQMQLSCRQTEMKICDRFNGNWCASPGA